VVFFYSFHSHLDRLRGAGGVYFKLLYRWHQTSSSVILFDKGALYMLGVGIGLAVLTYAVLHEVILKRPLTDKFSKIMNIGALTSIIVMIIFPQVIHYPVEQLLEKRGYKICNQASYQWFLYRRIVYTSSPEICENTIENKK